MLTRNFTISSLHKAAGDDAAKRYVPLIWCRPLFAKLSGPFVKIGPPSGHSQCSCSCGGRPGRPDLRRNRGPVLSISRMILDHGLVDIVLSLQGRPNPSQSHLVAFLGQQFDE